MRTRRLAGVIGAISVALLLGLAGCGSDNNTGGAAPPPAPGPGAENLRLNIQSATLPASGAPTVQFTVTDSNGTPVNLDAELATTTAFPRLAGGPRFTLAELQDSNDYLSYYSTTAQPGAYTFDGPKPTPAPRTQATSTAFNKASLKNLGNGVYEYTLPTPSSTSGFDRTKTHTVAGWVERDLDADTTQAAGGSFNFVPNGGTARKYETVTTDACNRCHGQLTAHGARRDTQLCITCHSPQTGDPETNRTVDFKVMVHKIHRGSDLPSVQGGGKYFIVGFRQSVVDFSDVTFPFEGGVRHCTVCHQGQNGDDWKLKPSAATCTSCHDDVKFSTAEAPKFCNDTTLQPGENCAHVVAINVTDANANDTSLCAGCHAAGSTVAPIDSFHFSD